MDTKIRGKHELPKSKKLLSLIEKMVCNTEKSFEDEYKGGFDVVIGNPPWGAKVNKTQKKYIQDNFICTTGEIETYVHFTDLAMRRLVKRNGFVGLITPNTWYYLDKYISIRKLVLKYSVKILVELEKKIFNDAPDIVPAIFIINNKLSFSDYQVTTFKQLKGFVPTFLIDDAIFIQSTINTLNWKSFEAISFNLIMTDPVKLILLKMQFKSLSLGKKYNVRYGIKTGDNKKYVMKQKPEKSSNWKFCLSSASSIARYTINWEGDFLNYGEHLAGYTKNSLENKKILIQYIRKLSLERRLICAFDKNGKYYPLNNFSFVEEKTDEFSLLFLIAILNSTLMNFYFKNVHIDYNIKPKYIEKLPIQLQNLNFRIKIEKNVTEFIDLYEKFISQKEKFKDNFDIERLSLKLSHFYEYDFKTLLAEFEKNKVKISLKEQDEWEEYFNSKKSEINSLQVEITELENEIDKQVYEIYDLTDEEIKIVENSFKNN